jgi:hypothetical protein
MASSKSLKKVSEKKNKKTTTKQTQKQNQKQVVNVTINNQKQSAARKTSSKSSSSRKPPLNPIITPIQGMRVLDTFPPPPPKIFEASNNDVINAINSVPSTLAGLINTQQNQLATGSARPKPVTPRITPRITTQPTPPAITPRDTPTFTPRASSAPSFGGLESLEAFESLSPLKLSPPTPTPSEKNSVNVLQRAFRNKLARNKLNKLAQDDIETTDMMRAEAIARIAQSPQPTKGQYTFSSNGRSLFHSPTPSSIQPKRNPELTKVLKEAAGRGWELTEGGTKPPRPNQSIINAAKKVAKETARVAKNLTKDGTEPPRANKSGKFDRTAGNLGRGNRGSAFAQELQASLLYSEPSQMVDVHLQGAKTGANLTPRKLRSGTKIGD